MKIRPLHDRVIVKRIEEERKTASGIVIPDTAAEKPDQGEIVAVGKGKRDDSGKVIALDVKPGDKVASLAMNHSRHLVSWYGVAGMGGVLHTVNPRLFDDQLEYIVNHAEDRVLCYDAAFQPIVDRMKDRWPTVEHYICYDSGAHAPAFEDWIGAQDGDFEWVTGPDMRAGAKSDRAHVVVTITEDTP